MKDIANLDRPYLRNGEPGNTKNVFENVWDYSNPRPGFSEVEVRELHLKDLNNTKIINNT